MTTRDETRVFFDSIAGRYDRVYAPTAAESRARMAEILGELTPGSRVLDLGVGTGRELSALLDAGHSVVGLDVSPEMLARCARRSRPVPLVQADLWETLPFSADAFDAVLALHGTLAHAPSAGAVKLLLREVARVLAPGGRFVMEVPLPRWVDSARGAFEDDDRAIHPVGEGRARVTDRVTGAAIETLLVGAETWREALGTDLGLRQCVERGDELLLVAGKKAPSRDVR